MTKINNALKKEYCLYFVAHQNMHIEENNFMENIYKEYNKTLIQHIMRRNVGKIIILHVHNSCISIDLLKPCCMFSVVGCEKKTKKPCDT